jgi:hypothetical protein
MDEYNPTNVDRNINAAPIAKYLPIFGYWMSVMTG